jgi:protein TonB
VGRGAAPAFLLSAAIHAALFAVLLSVPVSARRVETVAVEITETARAKPPPDPKEPEPRPPRKVAAAAPPQARPARAQPAPPPPNAPPPPDALAPQKAPLRIGISMSSTTEAGTLAAPVGNSLYGKAPQRAPDPSTVQPYRADHYAPPAEVTALPEPISCAVPKSEYPDEAKRIGFEGTVRLRLRIDEEGHVTNAKVIEDPGHGLGAAAVRSISRWCRFRPATRKSETVATDIPFTVHFELP